MNITRLSFILVLLLSLSACSIRYDNIDFDKEKKITTVSAIDGGDELKIKDLTKAIIALDPDNIDPIEANWVAREGVLYPKHLANEYQLMWPPNYQNVLVNTGQREKGLCYQWARDMTSHIAKKDYKTLTMQRAVANQGGNYEHNVLTVAAKGKGVEDAIILDPWRHASILYWVKTKDDPNYQWTKYYPRTYYLDTNNKKVYIPNQNNPANLTN
ncbi:MAG TPA: hypothetical protein EYG71_00795 [Leucothrix sp.]|nr:hypothetical protein [Leucothrix sp.]